MLLIVGPERKGLNVPEGLFCSRSPFFHAALKHCWQNGSRKKKKKKVQLPDDALSIVTLYVQHLYTSKIHLQKTTSEDGLRTTDNLPEYHILADLYVFGERTQDVIFRNAVIEAFVGRMAEPLNRRWPWSPTTTVIDKLYKETMPGSPVRQLMVDVYKTRGCGHWITDRTEDHNKEFLMDLSRTLLDAPRSQTVFGSPYFNMLNYHE